MTVDRAGVRDVALLAGVSLGTVSNVINRPESVSEATRTKVLQAMEELNFVWPSKRTKKIREENKILGVLVPDLTNPFYGTLAGSFDETANRFGFKTVVCSTNSSVDSEEKNLEMLQSLGAAGVCFTPICAGSKSVQKFGRTVSDGTPGVFVDYRDSELECPSITVNDELGGYLAMNHLLELGHRQIMWVTGSSLMQQIVAREAGLRQAVVEFDLQASIERVEVPYIDSTEVVFSTAGNMVLQNLEKRIGEPWPTAVVCVNDLVALSLEMSLANAGVRVPEEISLVGFDDSHFAAASMVPLTSVHLPTQRMGARSAEVLIEQITRGTQALGEHVVFDPSLTVRKSTMFAANSTPRQNGVDLIDPARQPNVVTRLGEWSASYSASKGRLV
ncbi:MAG: LacI family transcriptional regulator [Actinobacteria bacterium]|nr:LacI family transcriptional regulator [Actinomycetota bacterium]